MGILIKFPEKVSAASSRNIREQTPARNAQARPGEVVIFTGVRYERASSLPSIRLQAAAQQSQN